MSKAVPKMIPTSVRLENIELKRVKERTARLISALEEALEVDSPGAYDSFSPAVDICESKQAVKIFVEVPGIPAEQIRLAISAEEIVIEGEKRHSTSTAKANSHYCCERAYGHFRRRIQLHWAINLNETTARLVNGTLIISLPKLEDRRGKPIRIPIIVEE